MKIYDITLTLSPETPVYPGDAGFAVQPGPRIAQGKAYNLSTLILGSHAGTHLDPPRHFFDQGAAVDQVPLEALIGPAWVAEFPQGRDIGAAALEAAGIPQGAQRLLFKTVNAALLERPGFQKDFAYITPEGARWLVARGVRLVAMDYLSVEQWGVRPAQTHLELLGAGALIVEGVDLRAVPPGPYFLVCLPLRIKDGDGSPVRAVLIEGLPSA